MTMTRKRGSRPKKTDERSRARRIRQRSHQAGSPDNEDSVALAVVMAVAEVARLSYQLRKRRVPDRAYPGMIRIRRNLARLIRSVQPKTQPEPSVQPVHSGVNEWTPQRRSRRRAHPGLGHPDRRPIEFVSGGLYSDATLERLTRGAPPVRKPYNALRRGWIRDLALDDRVAGTFLEAPLAKKIRRIRSKKQTWKGLFSVAPTTEIEHPVEGKMLVHDLTEYNAVAASPSLQRVGSGTRAAIGDYALNATMTALRDDSFVEHVKSQAPPDLLALLAGEDWGVMKF